MAVLRIGSRGEDVVFLHERLFQSGLGVNRYSNVFDKKTKEAVIYFQQTHLASDGVPLIADGAVGNNTWWALRHSKGKAQQSFIIPTIPNGLSVERAAYLQIPLQEHRKGVRERPMGSNRGKEVDKYFPQWWLDKHDPSDKGMPWCCFSVSWCDNEARGFYTLGRRHGSCLQAMRAARKQGKWHDRDSGYIPIPGDWFIMLHGGGKGHIGFLYRVSANGKLINTLEGNCGNRFKCGLRDVDLWIAGFVNPFGDEDRPRDYVMGIQNIAKVGGSTTR